MATKKTTTKNTEAAAVEKSAAVSAPVAEPLRDDDEIEVISLIPNVNYQDPTYNEMYTWENPGDSELLTFGTLKTMWRNHKGYFRDLFLYPSDDRVIAFFKLEKVYATYSALMKPESYTGKSINKTLQELRKLDPTAQSNLRRVVSQRIQVLIDEKRIADFSVIRQLEREFNREFRIKE